ncbi:MAG: carbamoyl-phosphate synthase domain-containing protein [Nitrospira sp.]|nr:carbamoyl-phosphate synthase domain-containing protein [Nitrospira sp.]
MKKALLALADGTIFAGRALGHAGEAVSEVLFNTAMTGSQLGVRVNHTLRLSKGQA